MFQDVRPIYEIRNAFIRSVGIVEPEPDNEDEDEEADEEKTQQQINKFQEHIKILGYNSKKFDINLFCTQITDPKITIANVLGSPTQYKSFIIKHEDFPYCLQFMDLKTFLGPGSLDEHAKNYAKNIRKGVFPYEALTTENYLQELSKTDPFEKEAFNSNLTNSKISDEDYARYLKEQEGKTRLEYLRYYNELDTQIMLPIIDAHITLYNTYHVDMLRNLSLSSCSSQVKYALTIKDFDINAVYNLNSKANYNLKKETWTKKVAQYKAQDTKAKRNTDNNVTNKV
jgi:hypothetical protein